MPPGAGARRADPAEEERTQFVKVVLADTEDVWGALFRKAGRTYEPVATNEMDESTLSTPALSEGMMFWRTQAQVIAIGS